MDAYRNEVKKLIETLDDRGKILFAVLTSERLYSNYVAFEQAYNWGEPQVLEEAISTVYLHLIKDDLIEDDEIEDLISRVELVTPDTEDFPGILTSFALDACTSVLGTLQFILDRDAEHIIDIATYARDTVDMFIQERDDMNSLDPSINIQIEHDDFMVREKERQRTLIKTIANMNLSSLADGIISRLRTTEPIIDLSLLP